MVTENSKINASWHGWLIWDLGGRWGLRSATRGWWSVWMETAVGPELEDGGPEDGGGQGMECHV